MDSREIQKIIPHRPPFLLVDKIISLETGQKAVGIKNVTANDSIMTGHFPGYPIFPGVLIVEALAQVGAVILCERKDNGSGDKLPLFAGIDDMRFRLPVHPGDQLILTVVLKGSRKNFGKADAVAKVGDKIVAEGILSFFLIARPNDLKA